MLCSYILGKKKCIFPILILWLKKLKPVILMCLSSQFLNMQIHKHIPITAFKYKCKLYKLHFEELTKYGTSQSFFVTFFHMLRNCFWDKVWVGALKNETLIHGYFSRFLNCTNGTKLSKASHFALFDTLVVC